MFPAWKYIINTIQTILIGILLDVTGLLTNYIVILRLFFSDISFYLLTIPLPQFHFLIYNHFLICSLPKSFQFSSAPHILVYLITRNHPLLTIPPSPSLILNPSLLCFPYSLCMLNTHFLIFLVILHRLCSLSHVHFWETPSPEASFLISPLPTPSHILLQLPQTPKHQDINLQPYTTSLLQLRGACFS